jgi:hypothetical protein
MRFAAAWVVLLSAGCEDKRSFDERYEETANEIQDRAAQIDSDLNSSEDEMRKGPTKDAPPN